MNEPNRLLLRTYIIISLMSKPAKIPMAQVKPPSRPSLSDIFKNDKNLAWEIMDTESRLYTESEVTLDNITYLASLYMRLIETLNGLQDSREGYFSTKMQKLMREPFITRAFNHQVDNRKDVLENRRKEIEQRIQQESEKHSHKKVLEQAIRAQELKQQSVREKIKVIQKESNEQLEERIRKRNQMRENRSTMSPNRHRERSWDYSERVVASGGRKLEFGGTSAEFQLKIDEDNEILRGLKRQVRDEEEQERIERFLLKDYDKEK